MSGWAVALCSVAAMVGVGRWALLASMTRRRAKRSEARPDRTTDPDLSVVIPLKGWDDGLPELLRTLTSSDYGGAVDVIVVVDADHPRRSELDAEGAVRLHVPRAAAGWMDKTSRLAQGVELARHDTIMFLDSDAVVDVGFLRRRLCAHPLREPTGFSFSIPLYRAPTTAAEQFLASFTNHANLSAFLAGSLFAPIEIAIGVCMVFHGDKGFLSDALQAVRSEPTDDQGLAFVYAGQGRSIHCSSEFVTVQKPGATWSEVLRQILRWLLYLRISRHLITKRSFVLLALASAASLAGVVSLFAAVLLSAFVSGAWVALLASTGVALLLVEAVGVIVTERSTAAVERGTAFHHMLWVPIVLLLLPVLTAAALSRRVYEWRGTKYPSAPG